MKFNNVPIVIEYRIGEASLAVNEYMYSLKDSDNVKLLTLWNTDKYPRVVHYNAVVDWENSMRPGPSFKLWGLFQGTFYQWDLGGLKLWN